MRGLGRGNDGCSSGKDRMLFTGSEESDAETETSRFKFLSSRNA